MPQVKFKITNNGSISGKKEIAFLTGAPLTFYGSPSFIAFSIKFREADETTSAVPVDGTLNSRRAVEEFEYNFPVNTRKISSLTKLYLPEDTQDVNAITLQDYFSTKVINSYAGVGGGDQTWKFAEGLLKEAVSIMQANGELSI